MLAHKRLIITGLVTTDSIAFAGAERAQLMGAEVLLTAFPRDRHLAEQAAAILPRTAPIADQDATQPDQVDAHIDRARADRGRVDGVLHAIAFAPRDALAGDFLAASGDGIALAMQTSVVSYAALARVLAELAPEDGGALVGLDFDAAGAWPVYNWMGVCKGALESANRYLARDLGPRGVRANLVAAGPLHTRAAGGIPGFDLLLEAWERGAPLPWDPADPGPVADAVCFLLSDWARAISGEILHVAGGYHAMASALRPAAVDREAPSPVR